MKQTLFSQHLGLYFEEYLPNVRSYSPNTIASYQDAFRLLLEYMSEERRIKPYLLDYKHLSSDVILSYLDWLETHRNSSISTRNQRLSAISAFFKYASLRTFHLRKHLVMFFPISRYKSLASCCRRQIPESRWSGAILCYLVCSTTAVPGRKNYAISA